MADYTFFFNPMSRARIARWALHEVNADYEAVLVDWGQKPAGLLAANPMGKLPTIIHHTASGDHVVSEGAAVCHYLAEAEGSDLLPTAAEKASYFRWLFFAAGPIEAATTARAMGWEVPEGQEGTAGFGTYDRMVDTLDWWLSGNHFACGERFTMADVYLGSQVNWGVEFKSLPDRSSFAAYAERVCARPAYREALAIDLAMVGEVQPEA
ncbi:glutathione S-transferase family protein [Altererythrobacter sp. KTW20L]|uniref:glutathione S-transferase family protein n=1 Tax=Altererythrobacter sp. KTW20L TaxID=2942210 RepID=UPI0020C0504F|nr:glutathione S-transferase family protein [Altererythrobacter sp. KTW20L]MCL6249607.1 glutathione S-transferase family protein [Altererythrobacter sp. KTW20L]